jgi:predicted GH43/DUF377 family glycosyl hydrolase
MNLAQLALNNGGRIAQLILPSEVTKGMGTMNPSIFLDGDRLLVNIRVLNYILYHNESQRYQHFYGPLQYIHPESDVKLRTYNFVAELNDDLTIKWFQPVDSRLFDREPLWDFVGLEDARLFKVGSDFYICGVRRDTTTNGEGRMELSKILISEKAVIEVGRERVPTPPPNNSYCEKNWVPILDKEPFHFLKWTSPTEVVHYNNGQTKTVALNEAPGFKADIRGSSQVLPVKEGYLTVTHEVYLYTSELGSKNATYRHRFILFDKDMKLVKSSKAFSFMSAEIEFCCGAAIKGDNIIISFGFQDNSAFLLEMPLELVYDQLN